MTTEAGRRLLDGLADALGTTSDSAMGAHGEQFRERIVEAVTRGVAAIEAEAYRDGFDAALSEAAERVRAMQGFQEVNDAFLALRAALPDGWQERGNPGDDE